MNRFAKENYLFRFFCGLTSSVSTKLLSNLNWYDGTTTVKTNSRWQKQSKQQQQQQQIQIQSQKGIMDYCSKVMKKIATKAKNKQVCCIDFLINDIARSSLQQALTIEKAYDDSRIPGLMYCRYKMQTSLNSEIKDLRII